MKNKKPVIRFKGFSEEWEEKELGKVANFIKGRGYSKNDIVESGTPIVLYGRLYTNYQTVIEEVDTFALKQKGSVFSNGNEVIVPASGETAEDIARASAIIKSGVLLGGDLNIIYPNEEINSIFLAIAISNGQTQIELSKKAQGKSVVHLRIGDLEKVGITYPNKTEQTQIGNFFKNLDNLITLHQRKYEKLGVLKKAMLEKMFPKNGANIPEIRFKGFEGAWEEKKLGEIGSVVMNRRVFKNQTSETGEIPFYKIGTFGSEPDAFISRSLFEEYKSKYPYPEKGDILISASGSIGRTVEYLGKDEYFQDSNIVWLKHDERVLNSFLKHFYTIVKWSGLEGSTIKRLYNKSILDTLIALPSPKEQQKIGTYFKNLDDLLRLHEKELEKLKNLKKALLVKMFV